MPINRLVKDKRTPEEIELLNMAFNHALSLLAVVDRDDPLCDMVARAVIEVSATGISEPREIAEMAVARMSRR
jgi:energy-converting hydrogenase Eha subunit E